MLLDYLLFFQEGFMVDLSQPLTPSQTTNTLWNICPLHPNLQFSNCVQCCSQETKGKNWLFHRKTLAKDLNGSMKLSLENAKPVLVSCVSIFIQAGGYSHKCVQRASSSNSFLGNWYVTRGTTLLSCDRDGVDVTAFLIL